MIVLSNTLQCYTKVSCIQLLIVNILQSIKHYFSLFWLYFQHYIHVMKEPLLSERIQMAHTIEIESKTRNELGLKVSWYDVYGETQSQEYSLSKGSIIKL